MGLFWPPACLDTLQCHLPSVVFDPYDISYTQRNITLGPKGFRHCIDTEYSVFHQRPVLLELGPSILVTRAYVTTVVSLATLELKIECSTFNGKTVQLRKRGMGRG